MQSQTASATTRIRGIDAARGTAMLFVCLSHFGLEYFRFSGAGGVRDWVYRVGMVASPTFMLLSGLMLGLLYFSRPARFARTRLSLADKGLFMLLVGHWLIALACVPREGSWEKALRLGFMTDAIGVAVLVGPQLVSRLGMRARLALSAAIFAAAWCLVAWWHPHGGASAVVRHLLVGPFPHAQPNTFPLLPWFAVYLAGTALGEWAARHHAAGNWRAVERGLLRIGVAMVVLAVGVKLAMWGAERAGLFAAGGSLELRYELTSPWRKLPPSPVYLLFYGGLGLAMAGLVMAADRARPLQPFVRAVALVGQTSLFVFIAQFYVYYVATYYLRLPYTPLWPLFFLASLAVILAAAHVWHSRGLNTVLTVRLPAIARVATAARAAAAAAIAPPSEDAPRGRGTARISGAVHAFRVARLAQGR
ncbi:MAG TPA: heparan-alpha-glucosaminide N-acetyltransferase domain-containing protein [Gemmatimonadaceae bacterium]|nr:heparan-alpha-glucosaminide N-acetyltransferase domain-containing protein [Gemmatimonadaceae bacterium]